MLLPSAFPFDGLHQPQRPSCTPTPPPSSPVAFISLSSCRALQAILGSRPASPISFILSTATTSTAINAPRPLAKDKLATSALSSPLSRRTPLLPLTHNTTTLPGRQNRRSQDPKTKPAATPPPSKPHRPNKRTRAVFESTDENSLSSDSNNNNNNNSSNNNFTTNRPGPVSNSADPVSTLPFSTPKRPRRHPLLLPLGLSAHDFEALHPTPINPALHISPAAAEDDDRNLVSTVLDRLNLSRQDPRHGWCRADEDGSERKGRGRWMERGRGRGRARKLQVQDCNRDGEGSLLWDGRRRGRAGAQSNV
jgi:hypothetical protein